METALNRSLAQRQEGEPKPLSKRAEEPLNLTVEGRAADLAFDGSDAAWFDALVELFLELASMIGDEEAGLPDRSDRRTYEVDHVM